MRNLILLFVLSTIISSCGLPVINDFNRRSKKSTRQYSQTDPAFNSYIASFEAAGKAKLNDPNFTVGDIPINFGDTGNDQYQGICTQYQDGTKDIIIRKAWWNAQTDAYKKSLIFHELGHCRLGREHKDDKITIATGQYKISLMNTYIVQPARYQAYEDAYLNELFTYNTAPITSVLTASATGP